MHEKRKIRNSNNLYDVMTLLHLQTTLWLNNNNKLDTNPYFLPQIEQNKNIQQKLLDLQSREKKDPPFLYNSILRGP